MNMSTIEGKSSSSSVTSSSSSSSSATTSSASYSSYESSSISYSSSDEKFEEDLNDQQEQTTSCLKAPSSRLFTPYSTLVTPSGRFTLNHAANGQSFLTLYNRRTWQICNADKLHRSVQATVPYSIVKSDDDKIKADGNETVGDIIYTLNNVSGQQTLVLTESKIFLYRRGRLVDLVHSIDDRMKSNETTDEDEISDGNQSTVEATIYKARNAISLQRENGKWIIALMLQKSEIFINNEEEEVRQSIVEIQLLQVSSTNVISFVKNGKIVMPKDMIDGLCMVHPPTYMNKVIVSGFSASGDGILQLVNVRTGASIYRYNCVHKLEPVQVMIPTPAVDTLAIATSRSHRVQIINLKLDRVIMTLQHNQRVESLSFSTMARMAFCAVSSGSKLYLWDLNDKRLMHAHEAEGNNKSTILTCSFLPNCTTLLYSTRFSVTKIDIDIMDDGAQQSKLVHLLTRGGEKEGVNTLEFGQHDPGLMLYGCGENLWRRHIYTGTLTRKLTRDNRKALKLGKISEIMSSPAISLVFTRHESSSFVQIWSDTKRNCKSLDTTFVSPTSAMCLHPDLSHLIVGAENGSLCRINIQSANIRGYYPPVPTDKSKRRNISRAVGKFNGISNAENKYINQMVPTGSPIIGISVEPLGSYFVSISKVGYVCKWDIYSGRLISAKLITKDGLVPCKTYSQKELTVSKVASSGNGTLMGAVTAFGNIFVIDTTHMGLIRKIGANKIGLSGCTGLLISQDGRRLYTSNMSGSVEIYDVPTNTCIDKLNFVHPILAISLDPKKGILATLDSQAGGRAGIRLWRDKSFYHSIMLNGSLQGDGYDMDTHFLEGDRAVEEIYVQEESHTSSINSNLSQYEECITFSDLPTSHYKQLFHLELIKERNKPKEQVVQKPPDAPFFLQSYTQKTENTAKLIDDNVMNDDWASAWSDDDKGNSENKEDVNEIEAELPASAIDKKRKLSTVSHARSNLAAELKSCKSTYRSVTELLKTMGPSSIDVTFRTLCHGYHDKEGLHLLGLACEWLTEALESRRDFDIVNAYLHRFMLIHGSLISGIEEDFSQGTEENERKKHRSTSTVNTQKDEHDFLQKMNKLKIAQINASDLFKNKMQKSLCLLQHFSKMI